MKYLQRVETHCLTYLTPQLAEIDRAFAIADVGKCSVKSESAMALYFSRASEVDQLVLRVRA